MTHRAIDDGPPQPLRAERWRPSDVLSALEIRGNPMRTYIRLTTLLVGLSATAAFAQSPPADTSPLPKAPPKVTADNPPPRTPGPRGPGPDMGHHLPPLERGARIQVENGRTRVDLRCADSDSTRECADALVQILDTLQASSSTDGASARGFNRDRGSDRGYDRDRVDRR
jgi:hypothetical protein